jgi:transposase
MVNVPQSFPIEFRHDVVAAARRREAPMVQIAKDFGISESCLHRRFRLADLDYGVPRGHELGVG